MAFDLYVWKWTSGRKDTDRAEIFEKLNEDEAHPALTRFDVRAFESAILARFGEVNDEPDGPFLYEISDFTGAPANWVSFSVNWSQVANVCPVLTEIAKSQGLAVYNPQEDRML